MSSSFSSYGSFIPDYQEEPFLNQLAQLASQLGQQQYSWAQNQFANTSALTDQAVQNYLDASKSAKSLADNNLSRYTGVFQPEEDALVRDAQTFASPSRTAFEMGKAQSGAGQAMDANRLNAERQLQSYGIDPSSGRYAELEMAQNAQRGAAQAGAGQIAQQHTEDTGRQLRGQAIQVGQQYPGQIVNALNSQTQALSGAVNAKLANLNAGTAALSSADPFLNTASSLKYPPLGNRGSSSSSTPGRTSSSNSNNRGGGPGSGGGAGSPYGSYGGGNPGGGGSSNSASANYPMATGSPSRGIASITNFDEPIGGSDAFGGSGAFDPYGQNVTDYTNYDPNGYSQFADPGAMSNFTSGYGSDASFSPFDTYGQNVGGYTNYGYGNDYSGGNWSGSSANTGGQDFGSYGNNYTTDPTAGYSSYDNSSGFGGGDNSGYDGGAAFDSSGSDYSGDYSGDMGYAAGGDVQRPDGTVNMSASGNGGQMSANGNGYSAGIANPMAMGGVSLATGGNPTTGGQVTQGMSPSGGRLQDDVPANLNEGEFVVPRDVAMWKGQEFFQKMIEQARKARLGASAQGKPGPRQPGPPRFVSQGMGAR